MMTGMKKFAKVIVIVPLVIIILILVVLGAELLTDMPVTKILQKYWVRSASVGKVIFHTKWNNHVVGNAKQSAPGSQDDPDIIRRNQIVSDVYYGSPGTEISSVDFFQHILPPLLNRIAEFPTPASKVDAHVLPLINAAALDRPIWAGRIRINLKSLGLSEPEKLLGRTLNPPPIILISVGKSNSSITFSAGCVLTESGYITGLRGSTKHPILYREGEKTNITFDSDGPFVLQGDQTFSDCEIVEATNLSSRNIVPDLHILTDKEVGEYIVNMVILIASLYLLIFNTFIKPEVIKFIIKHV